MESLAQEYSGYNTGQPASIPPSNDYMFHTFDIRPPSTTASSVQSNIPCVPSASSPAPLSISQQSNTAQQQVRVY